MSTEPTLPPLVGSTDPTADRWEEAGFGQPLRLTVSVPPGEDPGSEWFAASDLLGSTEGWAGCTGQTRLTWEADGEVFATVGDVQYALDPTGEIGPAVTPQLPLTSGAMVLNECEVPAFANAKGYLGEDDQVDETVPTVTVAIDATTHAWTCIDEIYELDVDERDSIAPDDDCR